MKFNESIYQTFIPLFNAKGFNESEYEEKFNALRFYKRSGNTIYRVCLSMGHSVRGLSNIYSDISFSEVTNHLLKIKSNPEGFDPLLVNHEVRKDKEAWTQVLKDLGAMPLKLKSDIEAFQVAIMSHVDTYILPFFEKYPDLQEVNDKILNVIPEKDYTDYIPGKEKNLKVLIIMRLCGNPKYEEFRDWALDAYKRGVEIDANKYGQGLKDVQKLVAYLESEDFKKD